MSTHNNSDLENILEYGLGGDKLLVPKAKQQILSKYTSKADLVEYLNGLRIYDVRGSTQNPDNPNYWTNKTKINNQLLDEIIKYVERE